MSPESNSFVLESVAVCTTAPSLVHTILVPTVTVMAAGSNFQVGGGLKGGSKIETATVFDSPSPEDPDVGVTTMAAGGIVGDGSVTVAVGVLSAAAVIGDERAVAV